jgi:hypothetical protein
MSKAEKCPILMTFTLLANAAEIAGFLGVAEHRRKGYPASIIVTRDCPPTSNNPVGRGGAAPSS